VIIWLINFVQILAQVLNFAILGRVIVSWLPISRESFFVMLIMGITEPILGPIRRIMPRTGMLDLSPFFGLILIGIAQSVIVQLLIRLA
jgi:YggT family protein